MKKVKNHHIVISVFCCLVVEYLYLIIIYVEFLWQHCLNVYFEYEVNITENMENIIINNGLEFIY
jgi:hypothetical protein